MAVKTLNANQANSAGRITPTIPTPVRRPSQQDAQLAQPQKLQPTALPRYRSMEQKEDAKFNNFFFRPGEIVWFDKGESTWGIGVIVKREQGQPQDPQKHYRVFPISHPYAQHQSRNTVHSMMRPFFSWSPPPYTNSGLKPSPSNGYHIYTFDSVNWEDVIKGKFGMPGDKGVADVDGSIMGVKAVEMTYTPFDRIPSTQPVPNVVEYNGIYIGCEKIWVGEPIRIRNSGTPTDIMVLQSIVERPSPKDSSRTIIILIGDTYSYRVAHLESEHVPASDLHLPLRVREDTRIRNNYTMKHPDVRRRFISYWRLLTKNSQISLADVKGRWYETISMFPHLNRTGFEQAAARGEINDVSLMLNGTGDCNKELLDAAGSTSARTHMPPTLKAPRREDAFRNMIPSSARISRGLDEQRDGPPEPVLQTGQAALEQLYPPTPVADGSFDQFMTFDNGEAPSAFDQQFEQTYYGGDGMQE